MKLRWIEREYCEARTNLFKNVIANRDGVELIADYGELLVDQAVDYMQEVLKKPDFGFWVMDDFEDEAFKDGTSVVDIVKTTLGMRSVEVTKFRESLTVMFDIADETDFEISEYFAKSERIYLIRDYLSLMAFLEHKIQDAEKFATWVFSKPIDELRKYINRNTKQGEQHEKA